MSGILMFLGTIVIGIIVLVTARPIGFLLLRIGLWMNGITGKRADEIIEFNRTGKLPE